MYHIEKKRLMREIGQFFGLNNSLDAPKLVKFLCEEMGSLGIILCGGAVTSVFTNSKISDLDFYVQSPEQLEEARKFLKNRFPVVLFESKTAITFARYTARTGKRYSVQLIKAFTGDASKVFSSFDFTITTGCYDFKQDTFVLGERFLPDLTKKRLVYMGASRYPICALYRTKKFMARGYNCPGSTLMHIALSIVQLKITTYGQLKDQLRGVDTMYLQGLLAGPAYDDNLPVDYAKFITDVFERIEGPVDAAEGEEYGGEVGIDED